VNIYRLRLIFIFLVPLCIAVGLNVHKIELSEQVGFYIDTSVKEADYGIVQGDIVLFPDEITYLKWMFHREESFERFVAGEGGLSLNLYGYMVGGLYILFDDWKYLLLIGLVNFCVFFYSSKKLLECIGFEKNSMLLLLGLMMFSPAVINLASGFMRDLLILAFINFSLISLIKRKLLYFFFSCLMLFVLRNSMLVILLPIFVYFFYFNKYKKIKVSFFIPGVTAVVYVVLIFLMGEFGSQYETTSLEILYRTIEVFTGLNLVVVRFDEIFSSKGAALLENMAHVYQLLIMMTLYFLLILRGFKLHIFFIPFASVCLLLAYLYGAYLGFFVGRTKLIILWLAIICIGFSNSGLINFKEKAVYD